MADRTRTDLQSALEGEIDNLRLEEIAPGQWRASGQVRSADPADEVLAFLEEMAGEFAGCEVFVDGPVVDPELEARIWRPILAAAEQASDVAQIERPRDGALRLRVRHAPMTLSRKRNRLPRLEKALPGWAIDVAPLGRCVDAGTLSEIDAARDALAPFLRAAGVAPEAMHDHRASARRHALEARLDAPGLGAVALLRLGRAIRDATDLEAKVVHRVSKIRARDTVRAALDALDWLPRARVSWDDRVRGVVAVVDAEPDQMAALERRAEKLAAALGAKVVIQLDARRELMIDRLAADFPAEGILTRIRHVDAAIYTVEALLPLQEPEALEAWSDAMEAKWGVEIVFEPPFLRAPDLRWRDRLDGERESVALRYNRPLSYPAEALAQARAAADAFDLEAELDPATAAAPRRDVRELVVLSIDPARTRDLDDALSIEQLQPGLYEVGVHIADVCPFVPQDSALDREALSRGFTTYLREGEIPVIPEVLANGVCSLHGGQDSLAMSLFVRLDDAGDVQSYRVERTVIHNHCRLNYAQAQGVLDGADHEHAWRLRTLDRLAKTLRAARKAAGSLDLSLEPDPERASHQLIEEFMLLANECVARFLIAEHPLGLCLYRTHPHVSSPDWKALDGVGRYLGCETRIADQRSMQAALEELVGYDEFPVLRFHVGVVLEKATYHFEQLGHGALAKLHYAHFTSPIRRYSDLIVHRLIEDALYKAERSGASSYTPEALFPVQEHINQMEIRVDAGSFESHRIEELRRFDGGGRVLEGQIVGLMKGRIRIRLAESALRVTVPYRSEKTRDVAMPLKVTDEKSGYTFSLGQRVQVRALGVDWARKAIEAQIVG